MSETTTTPWQGDWQLRIRSSLESRGHASLESFLDAHPGVSYLALADALGDANVAAMQLYGEHIRGADSDGKLRGAAIDCLSRFLAQHVKRGWRKGRHFDLRVASAFGDWKTVIRQFSCEGETLDAYLNSVTETLKSADAPEGWIPKSRNDPFLLAAFEKGWPL